MERRDYLRLLAENSRTRNHELIEECLNQYGVYGTSEITEEQLREFCVMKGLV